MPHPVVNIAYSAFAHEFMDVRVAQPIQMLRMAGANVGYYEKVAGAWKSSNKDEAKIAVIQRMLPKRNSWTKTLKTLVENDWLVVFEYDDFPKTPIVVEQGKWQKSLGWDMFKYCHAVQTTTDPLADLFRKYNDHVAVFPNQIFKLPSYSTPNAGPPRLFFGAFNREQSWQPLMDSINAVLSRHPDVEVTVVHERPFFDQLNCKLKRFMPTLSYQKYMGELARADIALLPLSNDPFNIYKSDIKFIEASACKTAVIASPTVYGQTVVDGLNGLVADTPEEWESKLTLLIKDSQLRQRITGNAFHYVLENRLLIDHIQPQLEWYRSLWRQRDHLNKTLHQRLSDTP